jgi:prepilin-type N-terminal cleavage/methylation domain-containing protein
MSTKKNGFTLIEIVIVVIALGFMLAGALVGLNVREAAELNSVINDYSVYKSAYNNFTSHYNALPGDFKTANTVWPSNCVSSADPFDCNGNGNGIIGDNVNEQFLFWKHLDLAGMLATEISLFDPTAPYQKSLKIGTSVPASKVNNGGYIVFGQTAFWPDNINVMLLFGHDPSTTAMPGNLSVMQVFAIDQKVDDGAIDAKGNFLGAMTGNIRTTGESPNFTMSCLAGNTKDLSAAIKNGASTQATSKQVQEIAGGIYYNMRATKPCILYMALN